jgi:phage terminase large subunit GpA-like protein
VFKSTASFIGVAYRLAHMPTAIMLLYPTYDFAKKFSETKWMPIIETSPVLQRLLPRKMDRFKKLQQNLGKSIVHFVGAGAEKNLKGNSVEILVMDELDDIEAAYQKLGKSAN